jgi:hypothetical protein
MHNRLRMISGAPNLTWDSGMAVVAKVGEECLSQSGRDFELARLAELPGGPCAAAAGRCVAGLTGGSPRSLAPGAPQNWADQCRWQHSSNGFGENLCEASGGPLARPLSQVAQCGDGMRAMSNGSASLGLSRARVSFPTHTRVRVFSNPQPWASTARPRRWRLAAWRCGTTKCATTTGTAR